MSQKKHDNNEEEGTLRVSSESEIRTLIFDQLKKYGALCPSQLSVRLGYSIREIKAALDTLVTAEIVEPRPDLGEAKLNGFHEIAYGLNRGKLKILSPGHWFPHKNGRS